MCFFDSPSPPPPPPTPAPLPVTPPPATPAPAAPANTTAEDDVKKRRDGSYLKGAQGRNSLRIDMTQNDPTGSVGSGLNIPA